jgi:hypothetical protein
MATPRKHQGGLKWAALLASAVANEPDIVPKGWFTAEAIARHNGFSRLRTSRKIRILLAQKKIERKMFRARLRKIIRPVAFYRMV